MSFENSDKVMRAWHLEYKQFEKEVAKIKSLTKAQISKLRNIKVKYE